TYTVTNTSAATTDPVTVTSVLDDDLGDRQSVAEGKTAGQGYSFSVTTTAHNQNAGTSFTNHVTATAHDDETDTATATAQATITYTDVTPTITVSKSASVSSVSEGGVGSQSVTYTYTVTNTSAATTDPVTVTSVLDDDLGEVLPAAVTLAPGQSYSFSVTTTAHNQNAGTSFTNQVTA